MSVRPVPATNFTAESLEKFEVIVCACVTTVALKYLEKSTSDDIRSTASGVLRSLTNKGKQCFCLKLMCANKLELYRVGQTKR